MTIEYRALPVEEMATFSGPALTALGFPPVPERLELIKTLPELTLRLTAFDGAQAVGSAGGYTFALTVPGDRQVETAGLTMVGVLPTHRRRGILSQLMRLHLEDARRRKQPLAALFASESSIYRRFGYGSAALAAEGELGREHGDFVPDAPRPSWQARLLDEEQAVAAFAPVWDRVRARTPGMFSRSPAWWRIRKVGDPPWIRGGRAPLQRVLLEVEGRPAAYALYRTTDAGWDSFNLGTLGVEVLEAVADGPAATAALWRYLLDLDLARQVRFKLLPVDHPLQFLLADARRLKLRVYDGLWVRLVEVEAALAARAYQPGPPLVLGVTDAFCPWNEGSWRLHGGGVERTGAAPDLRLPVDALGSVYLGAFRFSQLAAAGRVQELRPGALREADALFATPTAPWSPDIF